MATNWAQKETEPEQPDQKTQTDEEIAHMKVIRERFASAESKDSEERKKAEQDLKFLDGEDQWDPHIKQTREDDKRPCITVNKLPSFLDQIVGDQRQNRPSIKAIGVDSVADPEVAEILTGVIRNVEVQSKAKEVYDTAFENTASCGRGWIKVVTEYENALTFDQDIRLKRIANPFTVYWDPCAQELDLSDGLFMFESETISNDEFKAKWPDAQLKDFEELPKDVQPWFEKKCVRVANYYEKEFEEKMIYLTTDGLVVDKDPGKENTKQKRKARIPTITHYLVTGYEILEGPNEWGSKYFPLVPVWGKELNINGERRMRGLVRHAQDSQRMYNYFRSVAVETVALAPKSPFLVTPGQISGHEEEWNMSHQKAYPYLLYNHGEDGEPPPQRQYPEQMNSAIANEVATANQDMRDTTNVQEASLGMVSNERSGKAIAERKSQGDRGAFPFVDNLVRGMEQVGRVIVDLIPTVLDHDRIVRIIGEDGVDSYAPVNIRPEDVQRMQQQMGNKPVKGKVNSITNVLNDLSVGKYDVVVTVGPSAVTQRVEAAESMIAMANAIPQAGPVISDLIAANLDVPGSQKIARRLRKTLPPEILDESEMEEGGPPPPPDPMKDPQVALKVAELEIKKKELAIKAIEVMGKTTLNIAKAEGVEQGPQIQAYISTVQALGKLAEKELQVEAQGPLAGAGGPPQQ